MKALALGLPRWVSSAIRGARLRHLSRSRKCAPRILNAISNSLNKYLSGQYFQFPTSSIANSTIHIPCQTAKSVSCSCSRMALPVGSVLHEESEGVVHLPFTLLKNSVE